MQIFLPMYRMCPFWPERFLGRSLLVILFQGAAKEKLELSGCIGHTGWPSTSAHSRARVQPPESRRQVETEHVPSCDQFAQLEQRLTDGHLPYTPLELVPGIGHCLSQASIISHFPLPETSHPQYLCHLALFNRILQWLQDLLLLKIGSKFP
uniref:Uncharacterized protein n=1 Tax=Myotis myotis TaxID=51298 RepID=A0A7J7SCF5_MYOMY|nr:hypothetical protein mMyoMyo1_009468 [Myotis myotis]